MTSTEGCSAPATSCGTPAGWRAGGRCVRCRIAHNAETGRYRGLTAEQRQHFLSLLRAGHGIDQAATAAGVTRQRLAAASKGDGELRAALDGRSVEVQRAARLGDYLAALTRTGGDVALAAAVCGFPEKGLHFYRREQPHFAAAEEAVLNMIEASAPAHGRVTDAQLDDVAEKIANGMSMRQAALANGVTPSNLRLYARNHQRLAAALPPLRPQMGPKEKKRTPERLERLRELWPDQNLTVAQIAAALGVSVASVQNWAAKMGLPRRRGRRPGRRIGAAPTRRRAR
ncbi:hypothetical protein ACWDSL_06380 [Streptomyces sp. NPDC000941]